jgi:hypothetical protein
MSFVLTRMFAYFTLASYLVVGVVAVRSMAPEMTKISIDSNYLALFQKTELKAETIEAFSVPEIAFSEMKFPEKKKSPVQIAKPVVKKTPEMRVAKPEKNELPFHEPVELKAVFMTERLETNLASLYQAFTYHEAIAKVEIQDDVSTKQAQAEPEFFDYAEEKVAEAPAPKEPIKEKTTQVEPPEEVAVHDLVAAKTETPETATKAPSIEEIKAESEDIIAFDYAKASEDIVTGAVPAVSKVTTQNSLALKSLPRGKSKASSKTIVPGPSALKSMDKATTEYSNHVTIQVVTTNLKGTQEDLGFEVRFNDDMGEALMDYGTGSVKLDQILAAPSMTRATTILKRGYVPTNLDLILEEGASALSVPLLDEMTFNELLAPYEARGPIGAVLVELDDNVEGASLDVPYSKVIQLDGDLRETTANDFRYQLFIGVKAGNALLTYQNAQGEKVSKIIHVHERELSFDNNFFEDVVNERVALLEEDLLSREKTPLIVASEAVRQFATDKTAEKINSHTYKTDFGRTLLGARQYLELGHQDEPVFVGYKNTTALEIPSESFMRYLLSKFEDQKLGNRCMIQVNVTEKFMKVDVATESVGSSLVAQTQILDADGKFYDTPSEKSKKIIVVGENQGSDEFGQDGKINLKITYQDGSVQYLGSYCSPNTYLVEQL